MKKRATLIEKSAKYTKLLSIFFSYDMKLFGSAHRQWEMRLLWLWHQEGKMKRALFLCVNWYGCILRWKHDAHILQLEWRRHKHTHISWHTIIKKLTDKLRAPHISLFVFAVVYCCRCCCSLFLPLFFLRFSRLFFNLLLLWFNIVRGGKNYEVET